MTPLLPYRLVSPALTPAELDRLYEQTDAGAEWEMRTSDNFYSNPIAWLNGPDWTWLHDKCWSVARPLLLAEWGIVLGDRGEAQFTRYEPGQGYGWHVDHEPENPMVAKRAGSMVVQLNLAAQGGGLEFQATGRVPLSRGDGAIFPGREVHRATPPIEGTRDSLVFWMFAA